MLAFNVGQWLNSASALQLRDHHCLILHENTDRQWICDQMRIIGSHEKKPSSNFFQVWNANFLHLLWRTAKRTQVVEMFSDAKHLRGQGGSAPNQTIYIFVYLQMSEKWCLGCMKWKAPMKGRKMYKIMLSFLTACHSGPLPRARACVTESTLQSFFPTNGNKIQW